MAEGLLRALGGDNFEVYSAGTEKTFVRPMAVEVMREAGIDISHHVSKTVDQFLSLPFDYVITLCDSAAKACPVFPGAKQTLHWDMDDPSRVLGPKEAQLMKYRQVRDDLTKKIQSELLSNYASNSSR